MYKTLKDVKRVMKKGVKKGINTTVKSYLTGLDYEGWLKIKKEEYSNTLIAPIFEEWIVDQDPFIPNDDYPWPDNIKLLYRPVIKSKYNKKLKEGCPISLGFTIDCLSNNVSDFAQTLQISTMGYESNPELTILVRDYNNVNHTLTYLEYKQLCFELSVFVMNLRQQLWEEIDNL